MKKKDEEEQEPEESEILTDEEAVGLPEIINEDELELEDDLPGWDEIKERRKENRKKQIAHLKTLKQRDLRILVENFYDVQKLRIAIDQRIGIYKEAGILDHAELLKGVSEYLKSAEAELEGDLREEVHSHPLWDAWFKDIRGIGEVMAAGIIAYRDDIGKSDTISAFWKYFGLSPDQGKRKRGQKLDHNPKAKKHLWKCCIQMLKGHSHYATIYHEAKAKYEGREDIRKMHYEVIGYKEKDGKKEKAYAADGGPKSYKLHVHFMALRKMGKRFLADTWLMWRQLEGLKITEPYIFSETAKNRGIAHEHYEPPKTDRELEDAGILPKVTRPRKKVVS